MTRTAAAAAGVVIGLTLVMACSRSPDSAGTTTQPPAGPTKILHFYASPGLISRGDSVTICYGVENATSVVIEPKIRDLTPSSNRCFSATPEKSVIYKLTATGSEGEDSAQLGIEVQPARAKPEEDSQAPSDAGSPLNLLMASSQEVATGQPVTICYGVTDVASVRVDPPVHELMPRSSCFTVRPEKTTAYTVIAVDKQNREHKRQITVTVR